jgi:hypothetical protein
MTNAWQRIGGLAAAVLLVASIAAPAFAQLTPGKEYQVLAPQQPVASGDKIEVIEF